MGGPNRQERLNQQVVFKVREEVPHLRRSVWSLWYVRKVRWMDMGNLWHKAWDLGALVGCGVHRRLDDKGGRQWWSQRDRQWWATIVIRGRVQDYCRRHLRL